MKVLAAIGGEAKSAMDYAGDVLSDLFKNFLG